MTDLEFFSLTGRLLTWILSLKSKSVLKQNVSLISGNFSLKGTKKLCSKTFLLRLVNTLTFAWATRSELLHSAYSRKATSSVYYRIPQNMNNKRLKITVGFNRKSSRTCTWHKLTCVTQFAWFALKPQIMLSRSKTQLPPRRSHSDYLDSADDKIAMIHVVAAKLDSIKERWVARAERNDTLLFWTSSGRMALQVSSGAVTMTFWFSMWVIGLFSWGSWYRERICEDYTLPSRYICMSKINQHKCDE